MVHAADHSQRLEPRRAGDDDFRAGPPSPGKAIAIFPSIFRPEQSDLAIQALKNPYVFNFWFLPNPSMKPSWRRNS